MHVLERRIGPEYEYEYEYVHEYVHVHDYEGASNCRTGPLDLPCPHGPVRR